VNQVMLAGYLAADPAMVGSDDTAGCKLRVAINSRRRGADGSWQTHTDFFDVYVFGQQATYLMNNAHKGAFAVISGHLTVGKSGRGVYIRGDRVQVVPRQPAKSKEKEIPAGEEVEIPF